MSPLGRPWRLSDITGSGIFRAMGDSTRAETQVFRRNITSDSSNREAPLADFKKRKNMMATSVSLWQEDWSWAQTCGELWSSQKQQRTQCRVDWGLAATLLESLWLGVLLSWWPCFFVAGIYLLQKRLENMNSILKISNGVLQQYSQFVMPLYKHTFCSCNITLPFLYISHQLVNS